jgi:hypothetical protein
MVHPRIFAAVLNFGVSGAMLLAGPALIDEGQALAAARPSAKVIAARTTRARRSNAPPSVARRPSDGSPAPSKDASTRDREAPSERTLADKAGEKSAAKTPTDGVSRTKSATGWEKAATDVALDRSVSGTARNADGVPARSLDLRGRRNDGMPSRTLDGNPSAAKVPSETPSNTKAATEKLGNDAAAGDVSDASRSALDTAAPSVRRDLGAIAVPTARPVVVTLEGPVFDGGDVPRAAAALDRMKVAFGKCASVENALTKSEASIDLRFLVRAPGRAEGVDVDKARGLSADVVRCMTTALARSYVGAPSDDPVGVAVTVRVRKE